MNLASFLKKTCYFLTLAGEGVSQHKAFVGLYLYKAAVSTFFFNFLETA